MMIYCPSCGTKNVSEASFCGNCGSNIPNQQQNADKFQTTQQHNQANQQNWSNSNSNKPPNQGQQNFNQGYGYNQQQYQYPRKEPALAAIFSFFFPGLGYLYLDDGGKAIRYFIISFVTYIILIGFFIHIYTIFNSYSEAKRINQMHGYWY